MDEPMKRLSDLLDVPHKDRLKHELRIIEGLMANAIREKDWKAALCMFETAHKLLSRR